MNTISSDLKLIEYASDERGARLGLWVTENWLRLEQPAVLGRGTSIGVQVICLKCCREALSRRSEEHQHFMLT